MLESVCNLVSALQAIHAIRDTCHKNLFRGSLSSQRFPRFILFWVWNSWLFPVLQAEARQSALAGYCWRVRGFRRLRLFFCGFLQACIAPRHAPQAFVILSNPKSAPEFETVC